MYAIIIYQFYHESGQISIYNQLHKTKLSTNISLEKKELLQKQELCEKAKKIIDYLLENFSNAKVGLFTGLLRCFVACVLCTENPLLIVKQFLLRFRYYPIRKYAYALFLPL